MNYKQLIDERGIKHSFLADKIGVSRSFLSMCLNGKKKLPKEREDKLREFLGV